MALEDSYGKILAVASYALREAVALPQRVNRQTTQSMSGGQPKGGVVHFEVPPEYAARDVLPGPVPPAHSTPVQESSTVECGLDFWKEVDFVLTDRDLEQLDSPGGHTNMKIATAAGKIGAEISQSLSATYAPIYGFVGTPGTTPFASAPTAAQEALTTLTNQKVPLGMRQLTLNPTAYGNAIALPQMAADKRGDGGSAAYIQGVVPRTMGFDWSQDLMLPTHTNPNGTPAGWQANQTGHAVGDTTITIDTGANDPVVGDVFTVAGDSQTYAVLGYVGNVITYSPAAKVAWPNNAVLTFKGSHVVNLAYHPYAFGFASPPAISSAGPDGKYPVMSFIDPVTQIALSLEVKREHHQWGYYLSCLWGAKLVNPALAVRVAG